MYGEGQTRRRCSVQFSPSLVVAPAGVGAPIPLLAVSPMSSRWYRRRCKPSFQLLGRRGGTDTPSNHASEHFVINLSHLYPPND